MMDYKQTKHTQNLLGQQKVQPQQAAKNTTFEVTQVGVATTVCKGQSSITKKWKMFVHNTESLNVQFFWLLTVPN